MARKPGTTILLLTDTEVLRADFGSNAKLLHLWRRERAVEGGLATAAEMAMGLGPKIGRRVLVLTTAAWTQTLPLPASSLQGMSGEELAQTLKFEVESFSGVAAFESDLAHRVTQSSGEYREFWITQVENPDLQMLEKVVSARGAKLIGVCHPAGLPVDVNGQAGGKRLEFWRQTICCTQRQPTLQMFVMHGDPRSDRWQVALENWESQTGRTPTSQWLVGPGVAVPAEKLGEEAEPVLRLDERTDIEPWLAGWASLAGSSDPPVPLVRPPRRPVSRRTKVAAAMALTALVLAACVAHGYWMSQRKQSVTDEIASLNELKKEKRALDKRLAEAEKSEREIQGQLTAVRGQLQGMQAMASGQRGRFALLLELLSALRGEDLVIERLESGKEGVKLTGLALNPGTATRLAKSLHSELLEVGWHVQTPMQEGRNQLVNGGPWTFTIELRDVPPKLPPDEQARGTQDVAGRTIEKSKVRNTSS